MRSHIHTSQGAHAATPRRIHWPLKLKGDLNLNLEPLASLLPGIVAPGAQLLGEGKWHETLGFTPT